MSGASVFADLSPAELGLPSEFEEFRLCQTEALEWVLDNPARFLGLGIPTGGGKSLIAAALQKATGMRTVILTATRALEDQYAGVFAPCGMVDIRGKSNYQCGDKCHLSCRFGAQEGCRYHKTVVTRDGEEVAVVDQKCTYEGARRRFQWSKLGVTNYAYWIRANTFGRGLEPKVEGAGIANPVELLILDEAHSAHSETSRALQVVVKEAGLIELDRRDYPKGDDLAEWRQWAGVNQGRVALDLADAIRHLRVRPAKERRDRVYRLETLGEALDGILRMQPSDWVLEMTPGTADGRRWEFNCVWPGAWAEARLFCGVSKVVLMSATLRPAAMRMLGIGREGSEFREWPRQFPAERTPVYHVPTVRLNYKTEEEGLKKWVARIDEIVEKYREFKGIIHTVSYKRQRYLLEHSRHSEWMIANTNDPESETAREAVERFRSTPAPAILVSPSFGTGWDFPDDQCRWIIIAKVPFPEFKSKVMQARIARSGIYTANLAMQELVQMAGRATRHARDFSTVIIVDDALTYFMRQNKGLAPGWFKVMKVAGVPELVERVEESGDGEDEMERARR